MSARPPRLAVIVANGITGDSRVQKIALSAARDGWEVRLIGRSPAKRVQRSRIGAVEVVRVPVGDEMVRAERQRRKVGAPLLHPRFGMPKSGEVWDATFESRSRQRSERINELDQLGTPLAATARFGLRGVSYLGRLSHRARARVSEWDSGRVPDPAEPVGDWRHDQPNLLDLDLAFGPQIERFRPDVIHVNDITMLNTGAVAAARLRNRGHQVAWIYDAHEYVAGVDWPTPRMLSAYPQLESEYIQRADAVVTVSPEIAELIRSDHGLPNIPLVVRNTPVREAIGRGSGVSVRAAAGVTDDVPLLVYSGYIHHERGLDTAIDALPLLAEVHLAIVSDQNNPLLAKLLRQANRVGVADRVHPVPYVDPQDVADYLSTADVGVICSKRTINYEMSLPTKLSEYLHARLPVVVSDVKTLSAYVTGHEVGAVFEAGSPGSFATAVGKVLPNREEAQANITEEMLDDLSWERQAAGLLRLYRDLSGLSPTPRPQFSWDVTEVQEPRRPAGAGVALVSGDDVAWRRLGDTKVKLALGMANYAGQLAALAQAVTAADSDVSAEVITRTSAGSFGYPSDVYIPLSRMKDLTTQLDLVRRILPRCTHLLADAFLPVFGNLNGTDISGDLPALRQAGIRTALLCHGSEIRDPRRHLDRLTHSHFHQAPPERLAEAARVTRHNADILARIDLPVYVTTPDLLDDVPRATWVPLVVDVDSWSCDEPVMERNRPVVLHAPSKRWTKGTDLFLPDLEELDARGIIELRLMESVPWSRMRDEVRAADIVIDQVAVGCYGTFACEAMAAGKPVIAYLTETVIAAFDTPPPLVNTEPTGVRATIERLLDDRDAARETGRRASAFAREFHDGRRSAAVLESFLRS